MTGQGKFINQGQITGGNGATGGYRPNAGGVGFEVQAGGTLTNDGTIASGLAGSAGVLLSNGGALVNHGSIVASKYGILDKANAGSQAASGVAFYQGGKLTNTGSIEGGLGFAGTEDSTNGGSGVYFDGAGAVTNSGIIIGGTGGGEGYYTEDIGAGGTGIELQDGEQLVNKGLISGGLGGGQNGELRGTDEYGPGGIGVSLAAGGSISNTGTIEGGNSPSGTFAFYGGEGGAGIVLVAGGTVTNAGLISGGSASTITSQYTNTELGGVGIYVQSGGMITNSGTITGGAGAGGGGGLGASGGAGVYLNDGTLTTSGTIDGGAGGAGLGGAGQMGNAVTFGGLASTLIVDPGAVFGGNIEATDVVNDTLVLAGKAAGTLAGFGDTITGFTTIQEDASAHWTLSGTVGGSVLDIGQGARLTVNGALGTASVAFAAGGDGTLTLNVTGTVGSVFSGFGTGDIIDLPTIQASTLTFQHNTLTLLNADGNVVDTLLFAKGLTQADFGLVPAGNGTEIVYTGTAPPAAHIASDGGFPVQDLAAANLLHFGLTLDR
jgi:hypothetical protein